MGKIYIINGSPRKNWNTAKMCESFAQGAKSKGAQTEIINLYDLDFKGCRSCFACKLKDGKNFGKCAYPDDLTKILENILYSDGLVIASPIYFGEITGVTRMFLERLLFPLFQYDADYSSVAPKKLKTAVIYTMNVDETTCKSLYSDTLNRFEWFFEKMFTKPERITAFDTYQFKDYDKYAAECFDKNHKLNVHETQFPKDIEKAFVAGQNMAKI